MPITEKRAEALPSPGGGMREIPRPPFGDLDEGSPIQVLCIEDDPVDFDIARRSLADAHVKLHRAETLAEGLEALREVSCHVVLLDLKLPDSSGLESVLTLTGEAPHHPVVVMTGRDDEETGVVALKAGAQDYLPKSSLGDGQLLRSIRYAIERKRQEEKLIQVNSVLQSIRTIHKGMKAASSPGELARIVCDSVVRFRGYAGAWMFLLDPAGRVTGFVKAGAGPVFDPDHPDGRIMEVVRRAMEHRGGYRTAPDRCAPGASGGASRVAAGECVWFCLESGGRCYGVMGVHTAPGSATTREELELLDETAADIAYALHGLEARKGRVVAEAALSESEARYALLFNKVHDAILVHHVNPDGSPGRIIDANDNACRRYGYSREELLRMKPSQLTAPGTRLPPDLWDRFQRDGQAMFEMEQQTRDGRRIPVEVNAQLFELDGRLTILSIMRDISDRRRVEQEKAELERQLLRASRMEAIGKLAGGVAHDFNNLLSAIFGWSEMASEMLPPGHTAVEMLAEIQKAGKKAATVTRQLLAMSRKQLMRFERLDLNHVVADMDRMLRRLIGEDIELVSVLGRNLYTIRADVGQLEQVLLNLAVNARDAMPSGGSLRIATSNIDLSSGDVRRLTDLVPGSHVLLALPKIRRVMVPVTLARFFEPLSVAMSTEQGTGLGLSTVYGIVKQLDGDITVESEPGKGTTFRIYFPAAGGGERSDAGANGADALEPLRGHETILLVEDDESVRVVARRILEQCGYTVLQAEGFDDAVAVHRENVGRVKLLLTDVILRGWSGKDLADTLVALDPGLKVLFMSGYADDKLARHGVLGSDQALIHKPFTLQTLARKIREVLESS